MSVIRSAARLNEVIRQLRSTVKTPSAMLSRMTCENRVIGWSMAPDEDISGRGPNQIPVRGSRCARYRRPHGAGFAERAEPSALRNVSVGNLISPTISPPGRTDAAKAMPIAVAGDRVISILANFSHCPMPAGET